jgi:predicted DNA-binding transcriptional regulator AlpA
MRNLSLLEARGAGLPPGTQVLEIPDLMSLYGVKRWTIYRGRCDSPDRLPPSSVIVAGRVCWPVESLIGWRPPVAGAARGAAIAAITAARVSAAGPNLNNQTQK